MPLETVFEINREDSFKAYYKQRGYDRTLCLVPGWATDYTIFSELDLPFNYLLIERISGKNFERDLEDLLKQADLGKMSFLGFSLGGFLLTDYLINNPEIVEGLILISVRKKYPMTAIENITALLKRNKTAYLRRFYRDCFYAWEEYQKFRKDRQEKYVAWSEDYLLQSLEYFKIVSLDGDKLNKFNKVVLIGGEEDKIAGYDETKQLAQELTNGQFWKYEKLGHIPFLNEEFIKDFQARWKLLKKNNW
jgi:pimeloyl-ACP methyl ester carboxylesterase